MSGYQLLEASPQLGSGVSWFSLSVSFQLLGLGRCQRKDSHCCRERGLGCPGMEPSGPSRGTPRQGREGEAARAGKRWAPSALLAGYASVCVQTLTFLSLLSKGTLPSVLRQEGVAGAACLADGENEDDMVLGLAQGSLGPAHAPPPMPPPSPGAKGLLC